MPPVQEAKLVYRYFNEQYGLLALQDRKWKVGRLLDLNDPMDCRPNFQRDGKPVDVADDPSLKEVYDLIGITCFSASIHDPVIWSHYADSHRGLAIGVEFYANSGLWEVQYPEDDVRVRIHHNTLEKLRAKGTEEGEALLKLISEGFIQKAKSWRYESEYRQFQYLQGCTMIGPHYFSEFHGKGRCVVKRVILGARSRVSEFDIKAIFRKWTFRGRGIEVRKAKVEPDSFRIDA